MSPIDTQLNNLFLACNQLRSCFFQIEDYAEGIQEISMNASVAAGQAGHNARACGEIASQIAGTGRRMRRRISAMRDEVNAIVNITCSMLIVNDQMKKFLEVDQSQVPAHNLEIIDKRLTLFLQEISAGMASVATHVYPMKAIVKTLTTYQNRLFGTYNALKIEAIQLSGGPLSIIHGLAGTVGKTVDQCLESLHEVQSLLNYIHGEAVDLERKAKGGARETRHAA